MRIPGFSRFPARETLAASRRRSPYWVVIHVLVMQPQTTWVRIIKNYSRGEADEGLSNVCCCSQPARSIDHSISRDIVYRPSDNQSELGNGCQPLPSHPGY